MTKIYCDRCSEEIIGQRFLLKRKEYYTKAKLECNSSLHSIIEEPKTLCPQCTLSYYKWYNHPENDGKEEE